MTHFNIFRHLTLWVAVFICPLSLPAQILPWQESIDRSYQYIYSHATMTKIDSTILTLQQQCEASENPFLSYWKAYALYKGGVASLEYYTYDAKTYAKLKDKGLQYLKEAAETLEKIRDKKSEDYALLAIVKNVSMPFCNTLRLPVVSSEVKKAAERSIRMDGKNLRGWLALAIRDYHTPELYGGGKQFEEIFLRILTMNDSCSDNPMAPSWGKDEAYIHLIGYYLKDKPEKARALLTEALQKYPDNHRLIHLQTLL